MNNPCFTETSSYSSWASRRPIGAARDDSRGPLRLEAGLGRAGLEGYAKGPRSGNTGYSKLATASSHDSYTSNTSESFVTTKMFWIFLSTAQSFIFAPRLA